MENLLLDLLVNVVVVRSILAQVFLGLIRLWCLVPVIRVQTNHQIEADVKHDGNVGDELDIIPCQALGQLDLDKLVELLGSLLAIRAAVEQAHEHKPRNVNSTLSKRLALLVLQLFIEESFIKHELARQGTLFIDVQECPMVLETLFDYLDLYHVFLGRYN